MTRPRLPFLVMFRLFTPLLLGSLASPAAGQSVVMLNPNASPCAIFQALSVRVPPQCHTRPTWFPSGRHKAVVLHELPGLQQAERPYAFATRIQFTFDSYQLTPEAHQLLDTLAAVLKDPLMTDKIIRIEGHTDSSGSADYNLALSSKRALAVQHYLSERHSLAMARLPALGKGEYELYDSDHPTDAVNRRVQFVNVSDSGGLR